MKPKAKTILHVDMDAFFAAVEQRRHPELRDKAVVVGGQGDPRQRGVVSAASYAARRYGIRSGMPLRLAYRRCPDAVFLPVDFRHYTRVSRQIKAILHDFARQIEDVGLDEAFLDISRNSDAPERVAQTIKDRIYRATGLTCSIGIGPNKLLAKLASDLDKPDGLTRLDYSDVPSRVWLLPVRRLWGVGPRTVARMRRLGVTTIGDLANLPMEILTELFGDANGHYLYRASRGIDDTRVVAYRHRKSITQQLTFQSDTTNEQLMHQALATLTRHAVGRLRQYHYMASTVTVTLRFANFETHTRAMTLPCPTDDYQVTVLTAQRCLNELNAPKPVRLVGVRLSRLSVHSAAPAPTPTDGG